MACERGGNAAGFAALKPPGLTGRGSTADGRVAVSVEEAGRLLGIGRGSAYAAVKSGDIPSVRVGQRRVVVPVAALERMLNAQRIGSDCDVAVPAGARREGVIW